MDVLRLTRRQSREVDRIAVEEYGIPSIVLMENAARSAADAISGLIAPSASAFVLCGRGNNGGDGLAVARHLANRGHFVRVLLAAPPAAFEGDAGTNLRIVQAMSIAISDLSWQTFRSGTLGFGEAGVIVDALFGTGLNRPPDERTAALIDGVNRRGLPVRYPVVSLDVPSGLDADTGRSLGACIQATTTVTFGTEKVGFNTPDAAMSLGRLVIGDIGVPRVVFERAAVTPS